MRRFLVAGVAGLLWSLLASGGQAASAQSSLQELIDGAQPGDTLTIPSGTYHERIVIDKTLTIEGSGWPVIDGGGEGDVVTITGAESVTFSGFVVRNSGRAVSQEPAAIKVEEAHAVTLNRNRIESSHFGIHITASHHATISNNRIDTGNGVPAERRGHALYLWEVSESAIHANIITNSADGIHLEFSNDNGIAENEVSGSRYAIHLMSSHNNRVISNTFNDNLSGALLMFSNDLLIKDNELSNNRDGATGAGMLLKDVNNIFAEGNVMQRNKYGINAEGTPNAAGASAVFVRNTLALNDTGVGLFPNAPITFIENAMIENFVQVEALSGALQIGAHTGMTAPAAPAAATAGEHSGHDSGSTTPVDAAPNTANQRSGPVWSIGGRGNYWSDYTGYDGNGDGIGDRPYRPEPSLGGTMADDPTLRLFQFTLAQEALDMAADMFPVYQYDAVIEDADPLMTPPGPALPESEETNGSLLAISILLIAAAFAVGQFALDIDPLGALMRRSRRAIGQLKGGAA
jgi:nitrous oxidase accessory protein